MTIIDADSDDSSSAFIANNLRNRGIISDYDLLEVLRPHRGMKYRQGPDAASHRYLYFEDMAINNLTRILAEHGYDSIQYKNKFEDPGSISYIILKSEQAKIIEVTDITVGDLKNQSDRYQGELDDEEDEED